MIDILKEHLEYDPLSTCVKFKTNSKVLNQDDNGYYRFKIKNKSYTIKAINLVWYLNKSGFDKNKYCLYFKDTDTQNLDINNIQILNIQEFKVLKEALQNIQSTLRLHKHKDDMYNYWLYYKQNGVVKKKLYRDFSIAEKNRRKKYLENLKIVFKYCNVT